MEYTLTLYSYTIGSLINMPGVQAETGPSSLHALLQPITRPMESCMVRAGDQLLTTQPICSYNCSIVIIIIILIIVIVIIRVIIVILLVIRLYNYNMSNYSNKSNYSDNYYYINNSSNSNCNTI